jgi:hypothetical protein
MTKKDQPTRKIDKQRLHNNKILSTLCETYDDEGLKFLENMSYLDGLDVAI